jgi:hypothetical protein
MAHALLSRRGTPATKVTARKEAAMRARSMLMILGLLGGCAGPDAANGPGSGGGGGGAPGMTGGGGGGGGTSGGAGSSGGAGGGGAADMAAVVPDMASDGGGGGAYPPGPYGFAVGNTLPNMHFKGYRGGVAPWTDIALSDYYDPTGSRHIKAFYATIGKVLCGACVQEAQHMDDWYATANPSGSTDHVYMLEALFAGVKDEPATQSTIDYWSGIYKPVYDIVADPDLQFNGMMPLQEYPHGFLVNPRNMKICYFYRGTPGLVQDQINLMPRNKNCQ